MQSTKNDFLSNQNGPKKAAGRSRRKGSPVTEERAKAQRAKLDTQAKMRQREEEKEDATHVTQNKKTARQDLQAKRRVIETLTEAYIQDHIGGNLTFPRFDRVPKAEIYLIKPGRGSLWQRFKKPIHENLKRKQSG